MSRENKEKENYYIFWAQSACSLIGPYTSQLKEQGNSIFKNLCKIKKLS